MKKKLIPAIGLIGVVGLIVPVGVSAGPAYSAPAQLPKSQPANDERPPSQIIQKGTLPILVDGDGAAAAKTPEAKESGSAAASISENPVVGETRTWLSLDDVGGFYYPKVFTLKAINDKTEVWAASEARPAPARGATPGSAGASTGTGFLDGDCRNSRTDVTETQAAYLANEFQNNMLVKESPVFSIAPDRDGSKTTLKAPFAPQAPGQRTVVLVDNVRDANFYDLNNTKGLSFIAGFFSSQLNGFFDRNVMTIDGFDWLHRTGANPPNDPVANDNCKSAPARPFAYEGVFAHEYQHLLHSYTDSDESTWVNEGLSDWAESLTGYIDPSIPITQIGYDSHTQCMLGYLGVQTPANPNPRSAGGPENSLTRWSDQGDGEILCDYGAAFTFMGYVYGLYGTKFMTSLHNSPGNGLAAVKEALVAIGDENTTALELVHNWSLMLAVDGAIDDGAKLQSRYDRATLQSPSLHASINWNTPEAYSTPGAPSNGSDYVRLRDASGKYLTGDDIDSLDFEGAQSLPSAPLQWKVDATPPGRDPNPALYSGAENNRDESAITPISVGDGAGATLSFDAFWNQEDTWDFGFVQISTDDGATYKSLACTDTSTVTDKDAVAVIAANVPGFTGYSGVWKPQTCDLAAYAGKDVLLSFRAINDPGTLGNDAPANVKPGFWVDNVKVGSKVISDGSSVDGFKSTTQTRPVEVANFVLNIISIQSSKKSALEDSAEISDSDPVSNEAALKRRRARGDKITVKRIPLTGEYKIKGNKALEKYINTDADFVGAVITYQDPGETVTQYAPYKLTVNDVVQPGGGMDEPPIQPAPPTATTVP
jgi:Immune inhibitor A peptidase M6